ncbi:MAG: hypothetical protein ABI895_30500 [Deltaproteobacteria bacterium]
MLAAFQEALVSLAADAGMRRRFATDPEAALQPFVLGVAERAALCAIPVERLERFARALVSKRWGDLARVVPLTLRVSPSLPRRYRAWALEQPATAVHGVLCPGAAEGLRALSALHASLANDEREARYAADLFAFEVLGAASRGDGEPRGLNSRFALVAIADDVRRGLLPVDPEARATELRFERARVYWRPA